jgi:hypothetical protein
MIKYIRQLIDELANLAGVGPTTPKHLRASAPYPAASHQGSNVRPHRLHIR